jgi:hypothetical protein
LEAERIKILFSRKGAKAQRKDEIKKEKFGVKSFTSSIGLLLFAILAALRETALAVSEKALKSYFAQRRKDAKKG